MATFSGTEAALQAMDILAHWKKHERQSATLEEERREVLESIAAFSRSAGGDPGRLAACEYLLRHLATFCDGRHGHRVS
jgi:hypothetical protein